MLKKNQIHLNKVTMVDKTCIYLNVVLVECELHLIIRYVLFLNVAQYLALIILHLKCFYSKI